MKTVTKALNLLSYFTIANSEWGLSELARAAGLDKATTLRLLRSMEPQRFVEQDKETRKFRLGTAFLTLAKVREQSFPLASIVRRWLERIASDTGETTHASIASVDALTTIEIVEPQRSTRVHLDPSEALPFHATASGFAYLAFGPEEVRKRVLSRSRLQAFTNKTVVDPKRLREIVAMTRKDGYAIAAQTFELETVGIAVPMFDDSGMAQGSIAVATPAMRMTDSLRSTIIESLVRTSLEIAESLGNLVPEDFSALSARYQT